ncbi:MAG: alanine racemase [Marinoscillum sp.]|uniref:alanine racemase n=1 Tax=Marinoscillum sp. TaxID=2024838 RepID=UPI00330558C7
MKITRPTLLIDETKVRKNIKMMAEKARKSNVVLRPHFKTHQSATIGQWFAEEGITCATVSSVDMARYFADAGWKDLTIAFPYNPLEADMIQKLASEIHLNVLIVSKEALDHLNQHVDAPLGYFIKLDVGTHRTGVMPENLNEIHNIAHSKHPNHHLKGLLAHAGHTYKPLTKAEAGEIYRGSLAAFDNVSQAIGKDDLIYSYGDTPSCSLLDDFSEVQELRPGNFAFYDVMQHHFGSCLLDDVAVCMACPVVSIHPERSEVVVYGGGVHLSKDFIQVGDRRVFGTVVSTDGTGWETTPLATVDRLSQEHGIIRGSSAFIHSVRIGDLVGILPVHSCMAADLQGYYVSLAGHRIEKFNKATL